PLTHTLTLQLYIILITELFVVSIFSSFYIFFFFFFNDTATTEIYTLSLHDALPIFLPAAQPRQAAVGDVAGGGTRFGPPRGGVRSEEHTSELQSRGHLVCRLLLEKKKKKNSRLVMVGILNAHITSLFMMIIGLLILS